MKWLLLVAMLSLAACGFPAPTSINGTEVGPELTCRSEDSACSSLMSSIRSAAEATVKHPEQLPSTEGHAYPPKIRVIADADFYLVTLRLQDGSVEAITIICGPGVSPPTNCLQGSMP
jgi:hypothetical protein